VNKGLNACLHREISQRVHNFFHRAKKLGANNNRGEEVETPPRRWVDRELGPIYNLRVKSRRQKDARARRTAKEERSDEEDVPTETAAAEAGPRLSRAHGYPRWTPGACSAAQQRTAPPERIAARDMDGGAMDNERAGGRPYEKLRKSRDFQACFRRGTVRKNALLVLHALKTGRPTRVGFSVSRKLGKAVVRNRVKRRLREAVRSLSDHVPPGYDLVFSARVRARDSDFQELRAAVANVLERLEKKKPRSRRPAPSGNAGTGPRAEERTRDESDRTRHN